MTDRPTPYPHPRRGDLYDDPLYGVRWEIVSAWRDPGSRTHQVGHVDVRQEGGLWTMRSVPKKVFWKWTLIEE